MFRARDRSVLAPPGSRGPAPAWASLPDARGGTPRPRPRRREAAREGCLDGAAGGTRIPVRLSGPARRSWIFGGASRPWHPIVRTPDCLTTKGTKDTKNERSRRTGTSRSSSDPFVLFVSFVVRPFVVRPVVHRRSRAVRGQGPDADEPHTRSRSRFHASPWLRGSVRNHFRDRTFFCRGRLRTGSVSVLDVMLPLA